MGRYLVSPLGSLAFCKFIQARSSYGLWGQTLPCISQDWQSSKDCQSSEPPQTHGFQSNARLRGAPQCALIAGRCQALVMPCVSFSITWSTVKLAAFIRGGNSWNVARNCPTRCCAGTIKNTRSNVQS